MAVLDDELHTLVTDNNVSEVSDLRNWMTEVCKLDNKRQFDQARVENALKNLGYSHTNNQQTATNRYQPYNNANRNGNSRGNSAAPSMDPNTYPPKLTDEERRLLHEHDGCLKCRVFYAGHHANKCTITLSGKDYKPQTVQDTLRAKALKSTRAAPIAAISENALDTEVPLDLVAAIFPNVVPMDRSVSDGSDASLSSVSALPPLKGDHFLWPCALTNPTDNISVKACSLIDSGSHMVLVRPDLVSRLKLQAIPLPRPEQISIAVDANEHPLAMTHYIVLKPMSIDRLFVSKPVHAVIAVNLCIPLILGLPFLTENRISCDYVKRKCMSNAVSPPFDLLQKHIKKTNIIEHNRPDIIAAITNRIHTLSMDNKMAARETDLRTKFAQVFEPPPHANELPKEPLARITLKDANEMIATQNYPCP
jgi:hypothetical protein